MEGSTMTGAPLEDRGERLGWLEAQAGVGYAACTMPGSAARQPIGTAARYPGATTQLFSPRPHIKKVFRSPFVS